MKIFRTLLYLSIVYFIVLHGVVNDAHKYLPRKQLNRFRSNRDTLIVDKKIQRAFLVRLTYYILMFILTFSYLFVYRGYFPVITEAGQARDNKYRREWLRGCMEAHNHPDDREEYMKCKTELDLLEGR